MSLIADGVFDELSNDVVVKTVWKTIEFHKLSKTKISQKDIASDCCNNIIKLAMLRGSTDNLSVVIVFFRNVFDKA